MLALGTNDTANIYAGSPIDRMTRIERMLSVVGDQPVLWVNLKSLLASGPTQGANMQLWNPYPGSGLRRVPEHAGLRLGLGYEEGSWFISDGTHYTSGGYAQRPSDRRRLVHAFPASGTRVESCVVH